MSHSANQSAADLVLPRIRAMRGYVPGEQPADPGIVKLNTNENPFPVAPAVRLALEQMLAENRLERYPEPRAQGLRQALAQKHGRTAEHVLAGNGSDEVLSILFRSILEPGRAVCFPEPSYSLYPVLADIVGARVVPVDLKEDWSLNLEAMGKQCKQPDVPLTVITNPNAPTGIAAEREALLELARSNPGLTLVDEAYVEFGGTSVSDVAGSPEYPRLLTCNTFSKAYSLAGMRVGWLIAAPDLVAELDKVRDSYNLSAAAQVVAVAALKDNDVLVQRVQEIIKRRQTFVDELVSLGFQCLPSAANFVFVAPPGGDDHGREYFEFLGERKIVVRHFNAGRLSRFVRITIGTAEQMDRLLDCSREYLRAPGS